MQTFISITGKLQLVKSKQYAETYTATIVYSKLCAAQSTIAT